MSTTSYSSSPHRECSDAPVAKYRGILLFGAPGCGKGTQGKVIGVIPGYLHSSTGDIFRSLDMNSDMGRTFLRYSSKGELMPDKFTVKLWKQRMADLVEEGKFDPVHGLVVMDGVPRNAKQAELLKDSIDIIKIIYLVANDNEEMVRRLRARAMKENRSDDVDESIIRNRLCVYERETKPVLDCYPPESVVKIDANRPILNVAVDVLQILMAL